MGSVWGGTNALTLTLTRSDMNRALNKYKVEGRKRERPAPPVAGPTPILVFFFFCARTLHHFHLLLYTLSLSPFLLGM